MEDLLEILIPIIFFIIWTFSSLSANKKKQQRRPAPSDAGPQPEPQYPPPGYPSSGSNPMEDLKRTLEDIFTEMGAERTEPVEQLPVEKKTPEVVQKTEPPSIHRTQTYKERTQQDQKELETFYDNYAPQENVTLRVSTEELRKTIVLMEILSPPVSLRD